jgi:hypothetical protein
MGLLSALPELPAEDLKQIEIGNATLMAQLSPEVRKDPEVLEAAKDTRHSDKLREVVRRKHPDQHVDLIIEKKCKFEASAWELIWEEVKQTRVEENDEALGFSSVVELWASERRQAREMAR